jgi:putative FmdB family regulatory protein
MPSYPYRCLDCKKRFEVFMTYDEYGKKEVHCSFCGSGKVQRRISRVRFARSEESRMENLTNPGDLDGLDGDPRAMGQLMRQMGKDMGEDLGPEFEEVVGRLEAGQSPEEIEAAIPDLGGEAADAGGMGGLE